MSAGYMLPGIWVRLDQVRGVEINHEDAVIAVAWIGVAGCDMCDRFETVEDLERAFDELCDLLNKVGEPRTQEDVTVTVTVTPGTEWWAEEIAVPAVAGHMVATIEPLPHGGFVLHSVEGMLFALDLAAGALGEDWGTW